MALLRKPKRKTDSNFNFVQAAKLLIRFKDEGMQLVHIIIIEFFLHQRI